MLTCWLLDHREVEHPLGNAKLPLGLVHVNSCSPDTGLASGPKGSAFLVTAGGNFDRQYVSSRQRQESSEQL